MGVSLCVWWIYSSTYLICSSSSDDISASSTRLRRKFIVFVCVCVELKIAKKKGREETFFGLDRMGARKKSRSPWITDEATEL